MQTMAIKNTFKVLLKIFFINMIFEKERLNYVTKIAYHMLALNLPAVQSITAHVRTMKCKYSLGYFTYTVALRLEPFMLAHLMSH